MRAALCQLTFVCDLNYSSFLSFVHASPHLIRQILIHLLQSVSKVEIGLTTVERRLLILVIVQDRLFIDSAESAVMRINAFRDV